MDQYFVSSAFETLCQVAEERANGVNQLSNRNLLDNSDDDSHNSNATYDACYSSVGASEISKMTNFSLKEHHLLQDKFGNTKSGLWIQGRGKRYSYSLFDVIFVTLTVFKE